MTEKTLNEIVGADAPALYMAMDLAKKSWSLALTDRSCRKPTSCVIEAYDERGLRTAIAKAKRRFGLSRESAVVCCQEAGRDGFAVHRTLELLGVISLVVDPASIEQSTRHRQTKTDRLDARKLVMKLRSFAAGDRDVFSIVRVPSEEAEDQRRLVREYTRLRSERSQHATRIKALLATQGLALKLNDRLPMALKAAVTPWGKPVGSCLQREILREFERIELVDHQLAEVQSEMAAAVANPSNETDRQAAQLVELRGIGLVTAVTLTREFFGWREFCNRKQVGAAAGLTPTRSQTGHSMDRELGIDKGGNKRVRVLMTQIAWGWLSNQPDSKQTRWFRERTQDGAKRSRRKVIIAVARRLLVDLWKLLRYGVVPEGAVLTPSI